MNTRNNRATALALRQSGLISREDLERAERLAAEQSVGLDHATVSLGLLSEEQILYLVAKTHGIDLVFPNAGNVDADLLQRFPLDLLRRHAAVPLIVEAGRAVVAFGEVPSADTLAEFEHHAEIAVRPALASTARLQATLDHVLGHGTVEATQESAQDFAGMNAFYRHLTDAFGAGADELRFEPAPGALRVRSRTDGVITELAREPASMGPAVAGRARLLAGLPHSKAVHAADLVAQIAGREVPLRLVIVPSTTGELVVLSRRSVFDQIVDLRDCGLPKQLVDWLCGPFCAPAGSPEALRGLLLVAATDRGLLRRFVQAVLVGVDEANAVAMVTRDSRLDAHDRVRALPQEDVAETVQALRSCHPDVLYVDGGQALRGAAEAIYAAVEGARVILGIIDPQPAEAVRDLLDSERAPSRLHRALTGVVLLDHCRSLCTRCSRPDPDPEGHDGARVPIGCRGCDGRGFDGTQIIAAGMRADAQVRGNGRLPPAFASDLVLARLRELVDSGRVAKADARARIALLERV